MSGIIDAFTSNTYVLGWAVAFVVFLIVEGLTFNSLVSIWFAAASLLSMLAALAGLGFTWQLVIFAVASAGLLIITRPLVKRIRESSPKDPNAEHDIGRTATVIEPIDNSAGEGRVKLDGSYWAARSADGGRIDAGAIVTVRKIDGAKLIVAR